MKSFKAICMSVIRRRIWFGSRFEEIDAMAALSPAIANEFIRIAASEGRQLTQMQLQKLTYVAHGWNLAVNKQPLVTDELQAWDYGPVFPELYNHAKYFGSSTIPRPLRKSDSDRFAFFLEKDKSSEEYSSSVNSAEKEVIQLVWKRYGNYSAFKLSDMTHQPGTPWFQAYFGQGKNAPIPNEIVRRHYVELARSAA
jgi:uncharacterized phage-associated protein